MDRAQTVLKRMVRQLLPLRLQVKLGVTSLRASVDPLAPVLRGISKTGPLKVIEIGTRWGDSVRYIAAHFPVSSYVAIDPFILYDTYAGDGFGEVLKEQDGSEIFAATEELGRTLLGDRFQLIRLFSSEAAGDIADESANFVFVDGNHRYDFVMQDLEDYWPKVKPGGFLCGHDFFMRSEDAGGGYNEPMVFEAVEAFAQAHELSVLTFGQHRGFPMCFAIEKSRGTLNEQ